jgi:hypothetical protein
MHRGQEQLERLFGFERTVLEPSPQRLSAQQLHHQETTLGVFADIVQVDDIRMLDATARKRFAQKTLPSLQRLTWLRLEHPFDRDRLLGHQVTGTKHGAHPAAAQQLFDAIFAAYELPERGQTRCVRRTHRFPQPRLDVIAFVSGFPASELSVWKRVVRHGSPCLGQDDTMAA